MPQDVKILSSRRGYEFPVDELRLTMLSLAPVASAIQQAFNFQSAAVGTPSPTFGPVQETLPAGLILQNGAWLAPSDQQIVPIRFINIEPRRIVIDIAGSSRYLDDVYSAVKDIFSRVKAPDGTPVVGNSSGTLDYSELTARLDVTPDAWLSAPLRHALRKGLHLDDHDESLILLPTITAQAVPPKQEFPGVIASNKNFLQFALRAGSTPDDPVYFSAAPLDTDAHLIYLEDLERAMRRNP